MKSKQISFLLTGLLIIVAGIIILYILLLTPTGIPNIAVNISYSLKDGMMIKHTGGDTISVNDTDILVRPMTGLENYEYMSWVVNRSVIRNLQNRNETWDYNLSDSMPQFKPNQTLFIEPGDLNLIQEKFNGEVEGQNSKYGFNLTNNIGKTFTLSFINKGLKEFCKTNVTINP